MEHNIEEEYFIKLASTFSEPSKETQPLLYTVYNQDDKTLLSFLQQDFSPEYVQTIVNQQNEQGITPLWCACFIGNAKCTKILLEHKADPNLTDCYKQPPLFVAAYQGCEENVELLLENGANLYLRDALERTALHAAAEAGNVTTIDILMHNDHLTKNGAEPFVNYADYEGKSALHFAAASNQCDCIDHLTQFGGNINQQDKYLRTPLHLASAYKYDFVVDVLIDSKANLELRDMHDRTALHIACTVGAAFCVDLLVSNNADVNAEEENGLTGVHLAVLNNHEDIVKIFLEGFERPQDTSDDNTSSRVSDRVDPNIKDSQLRSLMHAAAESGNLSLCQLLAKFGTDLNGKDEHERAPIHYCGMWSGSNCLVWFVENKIPVDQLDSLSRTPLHYACYFGNLAAAQTLLELGAEINAQDANGDTPLLCAFHEFDNNDKSEIIELLLESHADPLQCNNLQRSPLHICAATGYSELIDMLFDWVSVHDEESSNPKRKLASLINKGDKFGLSSLHLAAVNRQFENLEHLVEYNGDINSKDSNNTSLLQWCCFMGSSNIDSVELLLNCKVNSGVADDNGVNALMTAVLSSANDCVKAILQYNPASIQQVDNRGRNALHLAAYKGDIDVMHTLLNHFDRSLLDTTDNNGRSCMHRAALHPSSEIIELLTQCGANIDIQDENGVTPLMIAGAHSHSLIVNRLLELDADPTIRDNKNRTYQDYLSRHSRRQNRSQRVTNVDVGVESVPPVDIPIVVDVVPSVPDTHDDKITDANNSNNSENNDDNDDNDNSDDKNITNASDEKNIDDRVADVTKTDDAQNGDTNKSNNHPSDDKHLDQVTDDGSAVSTSTPWARALHVLSSRRFVIFGFCSTSIVAFGYFWFLFHRRRNERTL